MRQDRQSRGAGVQLVRIRADWPRVQPSAATWDFANREGYDFRLDMGGSQERVRVAAGAGR